MIKVTANMVTIRINHYYLGIWRQFDVIEHGNQVYSNWEGKKILLEDSIKV